MMFVSSRNALPRLLKNAGKSVVWKFRPENVERGLRFWINQDARHGGPKRASVLRFAAQGGSHRPNESGISFRRVNLDADQPARRRAAPVPCRRNPLGLTGHAC
jgi:hypothetical protein